MLKNLHISVNNPLAAVLGYYIHFKQRSNSHFIPNKFDFYFQVYVCKCNGTATTCQRPSQDVILLYNKDQGPAQTLCGSCMHGEFCFTSALVFFCDFISSFLFSGFEIVGDQSLFPRGHHRAVEKTGDINVHLPGMSCTSGESSRLKICDK